MVTYELLRSPTAEKIVHVPDIGEVHVTHRDLAVSKEHEFKGAYKLIPVTSADASRPEYRLGTLDIEYYD